MLAFFDAGEPVAGVVFHFLHDTIGADCLDNVALEVALDGAGATHGIGGCRFLRRLERARAREEFVCDGGLIIKGIEAAHQVAGGRVVNAAPCGGEG